MLHTTCDSSNRRRRGVTLLELMVVLAMVAILAAGSGIALRGWSTNLRSRGAARDLADLLHLARGEAIRSGQNHVVFYEFDALGNPLTTENGVTPAWAVVIADLDADMQIDPNEFRAAVPEPLAPLRFGRAVGRTLVPQNTGPRMGDPFWNTALEGTGQELASAGNFRHPTNPAQIRSWVVFAPDGTPRAAVPDGLGGTTLGTIGSGDGAIYITNDEREYAVVMAPLGGVRLFRWDAAGAQWR